MSSVDGARSLQIGSDVSEGICSPCHYNGTEKQATHFCEDCKECLCQNCTDAHKGLRISRNHKVFQLKNLTSQTAFTQDKVYNVFCGCNMNLQVTVYCEDHLDVICASCKTLKHGKCKTVLVTEKCASYKPTKLSAVAHKAAALKNETNSFLEDRHADLKKLDTMKEKCKNDIKTFRKQFTALLDMLEQKTLKELENLEIQQRQDIERHLTTFTTTKQMVKADEKLLNDAMKSSLTVNTFAVEVKISNRLKDYERLLKDIRYEIKPPMIKFRRNQELTELQTKVMDLGTLTSVVTDAVQSKGTLFTDMNIISSSQVDIKLPSDNSKPHISGCAFLPDGQVILCDRANNNVKMLNTALTVSEVLQLDSEPWDVSVLSNSMAVITLPSEQQIQFLQTVPKLKTERFIQLDKKCWGIDVADKDIYVTCHDGSWQAGGEARVLDMAGNCKRKIDVNPDGSFMFVVPFFITLSTDFATLYVSDAKADTVTRLRTDGSVDIKKYQDMKW